MLRREIQHYIKKAVGNKFKDVEIPEFEVEVPEKSEHGDYSTNVAMVLAKRSKKNPLEVAKILVEGLVPPDFATAKVVPPGFINFKLSSEVLHKELLNILSNQKTVLLEEKPVSINIEFISANPTGPLTTGNGRGAFLGDALARILKLGGHKVTREYYINDARASTQIQELGKTILGEGEAYKGPYTNEVRERLQKKYFSLEKMNEDDVGYLAAQEIQKDNQRLIEGVLKIKFDKWYSEEKLYKNRLVRKTLEELNRRGFIYQKDGATWFRASQFGDSEDRVAIRSGRPDTAGRRSEERASRSVGARLAPIGAAQGAGALSLQLVGAPTYFLPDVAYHAEKLTKRKFDLVIDILGADHHGTFPRVLAGLRAVGVGSSRVRAIFTQIVRLIRGGKEVKMSKRKGVFITLEELVKEVGPDAARYFFLERSPNTHMDFDLALAKERSLKNPVYYIQYAHARLSSVLRKTPRSSIVALRGIDLNPLREKEELALIKKLIQFPEVIEDIAGDYQVHRLIQYVYELARMFHNFYERQRVISSDTELTQARIVLVKATRIILKRTLDLLGISAPVKM